MLRSDVLSVLARRWRLVAVALLLAYLTPYYVAHFQWVSTEFVFNDDERQWVWAMFRYADSDLFRNDYLFDYAIAGTPAGYKAVYWLGSAIVPPNWLSKFLSYGLLGLTVVFASLSAARLGGATAGWATAGLLLVSGYWLKAVAGGLPRSFNPAFAAATLYALVTNRAWLIGVMTPIAAAFYPPISVVMGIALTILLLLPAAGSSTAVVPIKRRVAILALSGVLTLTVLGLSLGERGRFGTLIDATSAPDVAAYPERFGRHSLSMTNRRADLPSVLAMPVDITAKASGRDWHLLAANSAGAKWAIGALATICVFVLLRNAADRGPLRLLILPAAAALAALLATALFPKLFYPSRYLISVPLSFMVAFPVALALSVPKAGTARSRDIRIVLGTVAFLLIFGWKGPDPWAGFIEKRDEPTQAVFVYLKTLPKDALIGGWALANDVPLLSQRRVLFSEEMHNVRRTDYALELRERVNAFADAYFSNDTAPLLRLRNEFGVTHILVDTRDFNSGGKRLYFSPFHKRIDDLRRETANQTRLLEQLFDSSYARHLTSDISIFDLARWA